MEFSNIVTLLETVDFNLKYNGALIEPKRLCNKL
jgi:hypothetical protein